MTCYSIPPFVLFLPSWVTQTSTSPCLFSSLVKPTPLSALWSAVTSASWHYSLTQKKRKSDKSVWVLIVHQTRKWTSQKFKLPVEMYMQHLLVRLSSWDMCVLFCMCMCVVMLGMEIRLSKGTPSLATSSLPWTWSSYNITKTTVDAALSSSLSFQFTDRCLVFDSNRYTQPRTCTRPYAH